MIKSETDFAVKHVARWMRPRRVRNSAATLGKKCYVLHEPKGVVLNLSTWNAPVCIGIVPAIAAIAAGNAFALKPSELAPHSATVLREVIEAEFPPEEFAVFEGGRGGRAGAARAAVRSRVLHGRAAGRPTGDEGGRRAFRGRDARDGRQEPGDRRCVGGGGQRRAQDRVGPRGERRAGVRRAGLRAGARVAARRVRRRARGGVPPDVRRRGSRLRPVEGAAADRQRCAFRPRPGAARRCADEGCARGGGRRDACGGSLCRSDRADRRDRGHAGDAGGDLRADPAGDRVARSRGSRGDRATPEQAARALCLREGPSCDRLVSRPHQRRQHRGQSQSHPVGDQPAAAVRRRRAIRRRVASAARPDSANSRTPDRWSSSRSGFSTRRSISRRTRRPIAS